jgi:manganese/zinc/iron transport system substrate-binding protein
MKKLIINILVIISFLTGCSVNEPQERNGKLKILATTGMIADAVKNIAGDKVEITTLMGPGVDPHLYKASHGDVNRITSADIVLYNGLHLEGKMASLFEKAGKTRVIIPVAKDIPHGRLRATNFQNAHDPHIWFDVRLWKEAVAAVAETLIQADSLHADTYNRNAERYLVRLDSLDAVVRAAIGTIPKQQRVLITAHDAFGYFGDAYGIEVRGLQGISTLSEFGLRDVTNLVQFITERKVKAIFVETSVSQKSINAVIEGCRDRGWNVQVGGSLYSDAMGPDGTSEGTYIGMVGSNVNKIVKALK